MVYAVRRRIQRDGWCAAGLLLVLLAAPWQVAARFAGPPGTDTRDPVIRWSACCAAAAWFLGTAAAIRSYRPGRVEPAPWLKRRRGLWAVGAVLTLAHVALAMHAGHGWSHTAAYRHTAEVGGVGEGVYVNYLFAAVWLADAAWMWAAPTAYRHRPRWVGVAVHGFLAFIVFNATVVFGTTLILRGVALFVSAALVWQLVRKWAKG